MPGDTDVRVGLFESEVDHGSERDARSLDRPISQQLECFFVERTGSWCDTMRPRRRSAARGPRFASWICATAYFVKLEDQLARLQLARLQLARAGSICDRSFEQLAFAATISASSLLTWEAGRSGVDMPSALQLARLQLARLQLARDQLARLQLPRS